MISIERQYQNEIDDLKERLARLHSACVLVLPYLHDHQDTHNMGGGWKSDQCEADVKVFEATIRDSEA